MKFKAREIDCKDLGSELAFPQAVWSTGEEDMQFSLFL